MLVVLYRGNLWPVMISVIYNVAHLIITYRAQSVTGDVICSTCSTRISAVLAYLKLTTSWNGNIMYFIVLRGPKYKISGFLSDHVWVPLNIVEIPDRHCRQRNNNPYSPQQKVYNNFQWLVQTTLLNIFDRKLCWVKQNEIKSFDM